MYMIHSICYFASLGRVIACLASDSKSTKLSARQETRDPLLNTLLQRAEHPWCVPRAAFRGRKASISVFIPCLF